MKINSCLLFIIILFFQSQTILLAQTGNSSNISMPDIYDLGRKNYNQIIENNTISPCEVTKGEVLTYCVQNGNMISYVFKNNILDGIIFLDAYVTRNLAERKLEKEIEEYSKKTGLEPLFGNGSAYFMLPNLNIAVSYSIKEIKGTYYVLTYTLLK